MRWETNTLDAYEDNMRTIYAQKKTVTDNVKVLTGIKWTLINEQIVLRLV